MAIKRNRGHFCQRVTFASGDKSEKYPFKSVTFKSENLQHRKLESFIAWFTNSEKSVGVVVVVVVVVLVLMPMLALVVLVLVKLLVLILVSTVEHLFQGGCLGEKRKTGIGGVHVQTHL